MFKGVEIDDGKSYQMYCGTFLIKFIMWGGSLRLWTVPYLNVGRTEAVKCVDGGRCCHVLNLRRISLLDSAVVTVTLLGGLKVPEAAKIWNFSPPSNFLAGF